MPTLSAPVACTITQAGLSAANSAAAAGISIKIKFVAFGATNFIVTGSETALPDEIARVPVSGYNRVSNTSHAVYASYKPTSGTVTVKSVAFILEDGTVFALFSQPAGSSIATFGDTVALTVAFTLNLSAVPPGSVEVIVDPTASITNYMLSMHLAANNPHPQYLLRSEYYTQDHKNSVLCVITSASQALNGTPSTIYSDGVTVPNGGRILRAVSPADVNNGFWNVNASGAWVRAFDADESIEVTSGLEVAIEQGTLYKDSKWTLTTDGTIVLGTTPILFELGNRLDHSYVAREDIKAGYSSAAGFVTTGGLLNTLLSFRPNKNGKVLIVSATNLTQQSSTYLQSILYINNINNGSETGLISQTITKTIDVLAGELYEFATHVTNSGGSTSPAISIYQSFIFIPAE